MLHDPTQRPEDEICKDHTIDASSIQTANRNQRTDFICTNCGHKVPRGEVKAHFAEVVGQIEKALGSALTNGDMDIAGRKRSEFSIRFFVDAVGTWFYAHDDTGGRHVSSIEPVKHLNIKKTAKV